MSTRAKATLDKAAAMTPDDHCANEAAIILQLVLGEYVQAAMIAVLLIFNAAVGFLQEERAQATLDALKAQLAPSASVRRDGAWKTISAAKLVPGDIVKLSLGGIVGADVRLIEGEILLDQSILTRESLPIEGGLGRETYAGALVRLAHEVRSNRRTRGA